MAKNGSEQDVGSIQKRMKRASQQFHRSFAGHKNLKAIEVAVSLIERNLKEMHDGSAPKKTKPKRHVRTPPPPKTPPAEAAAEPPQE